MTHQQATRQSRNLNQRARTFDRKAAKLNARANTHLASGRNYDAACARIEAHTATARGEACREQATALANDAAWERAADAGGPTWGSLSAGFSDRDLDGLAACTVSLSLMGGAR